MKKTVFFGALLTSLLLQATPLSVDQAWVLVQERNDGLKASESSVKHSETMKDGATSMMYMPSIDLHGSYTHLSEPINLDFSKPLNAVGGALPIPLPPISKEEGTVDLSEQDIF